VTAVAILLTATMILGWIHPTPTKQVVRYSLVFDAAEAMIQPVAYFWGRLALSPDGSRLAYVGGPRAQILVRQRNQLHATAIPGSERAETPFFSPDGGQLGFITGATSFRSCRSAETTNHRDGLGHRRGGRILGRDGYIYLDAGIRNLSSASRRSRRSARTVHGAGPSA